MGRSTARVDWRNGQALLPVHLRALEEGLLAEAQARLEALPLPRWGVAKIGWDEEALLDGRLRLTSLLLVLEDGRLLDIPGNARVDELDLRGVDGGRAKIYLDIENKLVREERQASEDGLPVSVPYGFLKVQLSLEPGGLQILEAANERAWGSRWELSRRYWPPLAKLCAPFSAWLREEVLQLTEDLHRDLLREVDQHYLAGESIQAARACLNALHKYRALLLDGLELGIHPYDMFRAFRDLYIDVATYRGQSADREGYPVYEHRNPRQSYGVVREKLRALVKAQVPQVAYATFERRAGRLECVVPEEAARASQSYLLVRKSRAADKFELSELKVSSLGRLEHVRRFARPGVPLRVLERVPFHHPFTPEVIFVELRPGEEWDYVLRERRLSFYEPEALRGAEVYLYWRRD